MTGRCHVKKVVVCVAQLVATLITVHGPLSFLSDVYGLLDGLLAYYHNQLKALAVARASHPASMGYMLV